MTHVCDHCGARGTPRPDVVWFGEMPRQLDRIYHALEGCDLFLSVGTSGNVYPAAGFVEVARHRACTIEFNLDPGELATLFDERVQGMATATVPEFVRRYCE